MSREYFQTAAPVLPELPSPAPGTGADVLRREVWRLYHRLKGLPAEDQPRNSGRDRYHGSARYLALEATIRALATRYQRLTGVCFNTADDPPPARVETRSMERARRRQGRSTLP